jgi:hypothetical protein
MEHLSTNWGLCDRAALVSCSSHTLRRVLLISVISFKIGDLC